MCRVPAGRVLLKKGISMNACKAAGGAKPKQGSRGLVEALEPRRLCSVTVSQGYPGYYQVNGDDGANSIVISVDQNARAFTLNGVTYGGVNFISVNGLGGNDYITVAGSSGPVGCSITDGDGNDSVSLSMSGSIHVGNGQDVVSLKDSFQGTVYTGNGNDQIYVSGQCIDAVIYGGNGNDLIDASGNLYGVSIFAGNGSNTIYGSNSDDLITVGSGSNVICCLNGNDTVYIKNGSPDTVYGGAGNDTVYGDTIDTVYNCTAVFLS